MLASPSPSHPPLPGDTQALRPATHPSVRPHPLSPVPRWPPTGPQGPPTGPAAAARAAGTGRPAQLPAGGPGLGPPTPLRTCRPRGPWRLRIHCRGLGPSGAARGGAASGSGYRDGCWGRCVPLKGTSWRAVPAVRTVLPPAWGADPGPVGRWQQPGQGLLGGVTWGVGARRARQREKGQTPEAPAEGRVGSWGPESCSSTWWSSSSSLTGERDRGEQALFSPTQDLSPAPAAA